MGGGGRKAPHERRRFLSDIAAPPQPLARRWPPRIKPPRIPEPIRNFGFLRAMAYYEGALRECPRKECARRRQCCGGPRGGFGRHGAIPLCRSEAVVNRAALADKYGDPRKRKHGREWAAKNSLSSGRSVSRKPARRKNRRRQRGFRSARPLTARQRRLRICIPRKHRTRLRRFSNCCATRSTTPPRKN